MNHYVIPNIITNNCVGAEIYNKMNITQPNIFRWNTMLNLDYINLIENYDKINWDNYIIDKMQPTDVFYNNLQYRNCLKIIIDKLFTIYCIHEMDITELNEKIKRRLKAFKNCGKPLFVFTDLIYPDDQSYRYDEIIPIIKKYSNKYKFLIISRHDDYVNIKHENVYTFKNAYTFNYYIDHMETILTQTIIPLINSIITDYGRI